MSTEEQRELNEVLRGGMAFKFMPPGPPSVCNQTGCLEFGMVNQWTSSDKSKFYPAATTYHKLEPGVYEIKYHQTRGHYFEKLIVKTEGLLRFPNSNSDKVIREIQTFWESEESFKKFGLTYRRGLILWGPAGSGKSSTIQLVISDVIKRDGIIFKFNIPPYMFIEAIRIFREIEKTTKIVVLMEDIDSLLEMHGESEVLNILDGVEKIENIIFLATTNYPEKLGDRIINRPSRFDKRFKMPHPNSETRRMYFAHLAKQHEKNINIKKWVADTENMSMAHLKEVFISVYVFGEKYENAIEVLKTMIETHPNSKEDEDNIGFLR